MTPETPAAAPRLERWLAERNRAGLVAGAACVAGLYPAFGLLDWHMAPREALPWLWATRLVVLVITLAIFPLARAGLLDARWPVVTPVYCWLLGSGISVMTPYMGGLASPYYAGVCLVVVGTGLLFVWPPRLVIAVNAAAVFTFVGVNLALGTIGPAVEATSNLAFLFATALTAGVGQVLVYRTQVDQVVQRVRLEEATADLQRAHAELKQLDEFKSRFFANMTHELRTPLAMVLTPLELILQGELGELSEGQRSTFQSMFRNALKLLKLINDLLDLSRLEESRLVLSLAPQDLAAFLRGLVEQAQVLARRKGITLALGAFPADAPILCDVDRLERVFVNLLSNAVKFTPEGGTVRVSLEAQGDGYAVVVEDDGPGFPPDAAERLFERFYQVDMAGTRRHGGTGIGLALARELVVLHGGSISAESDGQRGARFTVRLPRGATPPAIERPAHTPEPGALGAELAVELTSRRDFRLLDIEEVAERRTVERDPDEEDRPYTVLVVEDHPQVTRLVHQSLRRLFKVLAAPDGVKGLELALRERPSLVVTDLMMPGMDGLELTRRLREDPRTRQVPILMLTARGALDDRVQGIDTGVSAYLTKPFSPRELLTCARSLVRAKEETADLLLTERMESVEIVAAGLAHEINNPLNYVKNALTRIRLDAERALAVAGRPGPLAPEEQAALERAAKRLPEMLGVADSGLRRIAGTVELMRRYGRAGYRRELAVHDAWEAVRSVVGVVVPATGRKVDVRLELEGDGTLECVAEEFHQVLTNLVQNGVEAAPEEGGRLLVRGRAEDGALVLSVKDNGPGVPPDVRARLFTPFFTTKGPGRGMGLGLTIVHRVVQSLGGTIQVHGAPGEGAEFVVRVPRRQAAAAARPAAARA